MRVRGLLVLSQRRLMERVAGKVAVCNAIDKLCERERRAYLEASVLSWVPQPVVRSVTRSVAEELGETGDSFAERIVHMSVLDACRGPWNALLRMTSNEALIRRTAALFARSFDRGRVEVRAHGQNFEMVLDGWPECESMDLVSVRAGIVATLESIGRGARVEIRPTADGARYWITPTS